MVIRFVLGWYRMQLSVNGAKFLPSFRLNIDKGSSWIQDLSYHTSNFMPKKKQVTLILSCVSVRLQVLSSVHSIRNNLAACYENVFLSFEL